MIYNNDIELRFIYQEIESLRDENLNQNKEISMLKEIVMDFKTNKAVPDAEKIVEPSLDDAKRMKASITVSQNQHRSSRKYGRNNKRPARLLPSRILHGDRKNATNRPMICRFNGPPTNCSDLSLLGYTLNGFYQVQAKSTGNKATNDGDDGLEAKTIYCIFKQPNGISSAIVEKRVSISPLNFDAAAVSSLGRSSSNGGVHFNFKTNLELETDSTLTKIKFNLNLLNVGGGFDGFTRLFRAPKTGIYQLTFSGPFLSTSASRENPCQILFNKGDFNNSIHGIFITDNQLLNRIAQTTTKLNRGDKISVQIKCKTSAIQNLGISIFSGSLLEELV